MTSVLFVGDVVGPEAARWLSGRLPELRRRHKVDFTVVNGENMAVTGPLLANGFGMTRELVELLAHAGADAITGGNHSWDGPEVAAVFAHPRVLRPMNVPAEKRGRGWLELTADSGRRLTVVNLMSPTAALPAMHAPSPVDLAAAWKAWRGTAARPASPTIVDLHAESPWEKAAFATAVDGQVAAVLGTHTHEATRRCHLLPCGTAYVAEVGMTGRLGWTGGGFDPTQFAQHLLDRDADTPPAPPHAAFTLASGAMVLGAVLLQIEDGRTVHVERVD